MWMWLLNLIKEIITSLFFFHPQKDFSYNSFKWCFMFFFFEYVFLLPLFEHCFGFRLEDPLWYYFGSALVALPITLFDQEVLKIELLLLFNIFLSCLILFSSYQVTISNPDTEKLSAYECGFDPYEDARNVFDVRFYLIAILFLIFDLETIFFFPWCVTISFLSSEGIWGMIDFILELILGFFYAWKVGALDWK